MNDMMNQAAIEADPTVPVLRITRDLMATPAQLFRAHTEPKLFVRWVGPDGMTNTVDRWDPGTGGYAQLDALLAVGGSGLADEAAGSSAKIRGSAGEVAGSASGVAA